MRFINKYKILVISFFISFSVQAQINFNHYFEHKTLRFDFILTGNKTAQQAGLLKLHQEPVWGGPVNILIDPFDYGEYMVKLYDKKDNNLIYSKSLSTLFQEWVTTAEAEKITKSYTNSIVTPFPRNEAILVLEHRNRENAQFEAFFRMEINPESVFIDHSPKQDHKITKLQYNGDPSQKVDLVVLAEGYTSDEQQKFLQDARRLCDSLFSLAPYDKHKDDFNIWAVHLESKNSGTDYPGIDKWSDTALNSGFWTFDSERYLTIADYLPIRDAIWNVPSDAVMILVNSEKYGGGGIYNFYAIGTADNRLSARVMAHEFGHNFAGLGDEYFDSSTSYENFYSLKTEPWEPNITTLVHFESKWKDMIPAGTPVPTPVDHSDPGKIGVFEGGGYISKGIYRPQDRCLMRDNSLICPVCQRAIVRMIDFYCGREQK
ncbi:MAG: IgA Peptidase M64 [Dysgonamonadaceae bacterium]|jgi:hypothetical protein|nr:IgA Peptidase M64 [Dysgonamonadaceae bacterium]